MPVYEYQAVTPQGDVKSGSLPAASHEEAVAQIQALGLIPIEAKAASAAAGVKGGARRGRNNKPLGQDDIVAFTRQLAILVDAGLPLDRSLGIIRQVSSRVALVTLVTEIQEAIRGGDTLSSVLGNYPQLFSNFYISFIRSAELSGSMAESLEDLAAYLEKSKAVKEQVKSALIYPFILVSVAVVSLVVIVVYVLPEFAQIFEDMDTALPASTAFVLGVADAAQNYGLYLVAAIALLVLYLRSKRKDENWQARWDGRYLGMPLVGELVRSAETGRLSRSMGTLLKGGVPLLSAVNIAADAMQNRVMAGSLREVAGSLQEGSGLAQPLMETGVFPEFALQMVQVGEETGKLDQMLLRVADLCDDEVGTATARMLSVLEPLLIIGLGVTIGGIIMSVLVALMSINELPL